MNKKIAFVQFVVLTLLWLLIILTPIVALDTAEEMNKVLKVWSKYAFIFALFLVNRFVLMPRLFYKEKIVQYFVILAIAIIAITVYIFVDIYSHIGIGNHRAIIVPLHTLALTIMIIGFDFGLSLAMRWFDLQRQQAILEKENSEVKLTLLHKQISPHFFMNMLNNIHALVDINQDRAKDSIINLSKLMSYQLYETNTQRVSLTNEVAFIDNYINLMRLRFSKRVNVEWEVIGDINGVMVPPLIFLNFIENAFKHGVSYKEESFIQIKIEREGSYVIWTASNSNHAKQTHEKHSGIGVENNKNRLDLIYGTNYSFAVEKNEEIYKVTLKIPV